MSDKIPTMENPSTGATEHTSDAGDNVLPNRLTQLEAAAKADLYDVLIKLANNAKDKFNLDWIKGDVQHESMLSRIALSLEYIIQDADAIYEDLAAAKVNAGADSIDALDNAVNEASGDALSYKFGFDRVLKLALSIISAPDVEEPMKEGEEPDTSNLIRQIHACQIALIVRGQAQQAFNIGCLVGALKCFKANDEDEFQPFEEGKIKSSGPDLARIKILGIVFLWLKQEIIPSKKFIRLAIQKEPMSDAQFSRYLKPLRIRKLLHANPKHSELNDRGLLEDLKLPKLDPLPVCNDASQRLREANDKLDTLATSQMLSLKPSGDPDLVDNDVRRIKESLGPVYFLLLIQFGMAEIEEPEELMEFVQNLSDIGLAFK